MSIRFLASLLPRHWVAVAGVLALAAAAGFTLENTPRTYVESAIVRFSTPEALDSMGPVAEAIDNRSAITAGEVMVQELMDPQSARLIREAGGTANFAISLFNISDEEYPKYNYPLAMLAVESTSTAAVHHTFVVAVRMLKQLSQAGQAEACVPLAGRISISVIGDTGPAGQRGSLKRSFVALALLAVIAASMISSWLDGHRPQLNAALPWRPRPFSTPTSMSIGLARQPARHRAPRK